ncbi:MAG TPA: transporter, partial [Kofleriaceae bacterium]|nr:transporter [Kofleriaceae bacterium]
MRLSVFATALTTRHDDQDDVVGRGSIPIVHDQSIAFTEFRLRTELGLTERLGVALMLPFRALRTDIRYLDQAGAEVELVNSNIHHRDETLTGPGDPWLLGRYGLARGRASIEVQLGASIPFGRTEEDPFARGDLGLSHQHMQFGTGTVNPIVALELARRFDRWSLSAYALTVQMLYENGKGYQAGDRYGAGLAAESALGTTRWGFRVGTDLQGETRELWNGISHPDEGNQGRVDWLLSAGVRRRLGDGYELTATVKVPLVTHAVGGQLDFPAMVDVGISGSFALFGGGGGGGG